jgi:hypothetical protein
MNEDNSLAPLKRLIDADTNDLRSLAILLGEDPTTFYISTDLSGVDIRGQDLRGMNLYRTNIENSIFDSFSQFDQELQDYLSGNLKKRYLEISKDLLHFTESFFSKSKYPSRGWFIKEIIPDAARAIEADHKRWLRTIKSSEELRRYFKSPDRDRVELLLGVRDYEAGKQLGSHFGGRGPGLTALIIVGLLQLIGFDPTTDSTPPTKVKWLREYKSFPKNHAKYL